MEIFSTLDLIHLLSEVAYLTLVYIGVLTAMILDFITGVRKAMINGEATTSRGFRRTAEKASLYFMPMICLTCIDIIASEFLDYPYLTCVMGIFNIYIEIRSIWENTHTKEQTEMSERCAKDLVEFISEHKDDILKLLIHN